MGVPVLFQWNGEAMVPATSSWQRRCDEQYVVGMRYRMTQEAERSTATHNHEFAWLKEAWENFRSDSLYEQFPSPEHLRKYALIKTGYCTVRQHPCVSKAEADRLRATLKEELDEYALILQADAVVSVYRAKSQARGAMSAKEFQRSKTDILEYVAGLLGVDPETLGKQTEAA